ncbi:MAG: DinB family protein [Chloroflexota bacterium]
MELTDFVQAALDRVSRATARVIDGLSQDEIGWQPNPEANSIGLVLLHAARSEDVFVQSRMRGKPQVWEIGKWFEEMHLAASDTVSGYTAEQVAAFKTPDVNLITAYSEAVRAETKEYLKTLTPGEFERTINVGQMGAVSIGNLFALNIVHIAQHAGEISYIRGLKRGINK